MKFHRPLLVAGLASIGSVLFVAQAQNNDAQTKALEALRKAQPSQATAPVPVPVTDNSAQQKALRALREQGSGGSMPVVKSAPAAAPVRIVPSSTSGQEKAIDALRGTQPSNRSVAMPTDTPAQRQAVQALYGTQPTGAYVPAAVVNSSKQSQAVDALRQSETMATTATPVMIPAKAPLAQKRAVNVLNDKMEAAAVKGGPVSPARILTPKQEKLADLTRRYKADQISPHDYHAERAKIISEP
jgi:hypothetical protein